MLFTKGNQNVVNFLNNVESKRFWLNYNAQFAQLKSSAAHLPFPRPMLKSSAISRSFPNPYLNPYNHFSDIANEVVITYADIIRVDNPLVNSPDISNTVYPIVSPRSPLYLHSTLW